MPYDRYKRWPEFSFRNGTKHEDGTRSWTAYRAALVGSKGVLVLVVRLQGKPGTWCIPGYHDDCCVMNLGTFKRREEAAEAFLAEILYKPDTEALGQGCLEARYTNNLHPHDEPFSEETASKIWDLLVLECGALETDRDGFISYVTQRPSKELVEWRFQGAIGFGGKIHFGRNRWSVSCYREEENPYVNLMIAEANHRLQLLHVSLWGLRE